MKHRSPSHETSTRPPVLVRTTTAAVSLRYLLAGQIKFMSEYGLEVHTASADGPHRPPYLLEEHSTHHTLPLRRTIAPLVDLGCLARMIRLLLRLRPDIVHAQTPKAGLLSMLAARLVGVPLRIYTIGGLPLESLTGFRRLLVRFTERLACRCATHVWPNSEGIKRLLEVENICSPKKMEIIGRGSSNGIDLEEFDPKQFDPAVREEIRSQIGYRPELRYLLFVGRMVSQKGIPELIRVFERLHSDHPELRLLLVGPFDREWDLLPPATLRTIDTHPSILATGFSKRVAYFMELADLFVFPSHREGLPNVILQAGAVGCPVVAAAATGTTDLIAHEQTGLLHEVRNEEALQRALEYALRHPDRMRTFAENLRRRVVRDYRREDVHRAILDRYRQLLGFRGDIHNSSSGNT